MGSDYPDSLLRAAREVVREDPRHPYDADGYCASLIAQLADALEAALREKRAAMEAAYEQGHARGYFIATADADTRLGDFKSLRRAALDRIEERKS